MCQPNCIKVRRLANNNRNTKHIPLCVGLCMRKHLCPFVSTHTNRPSLIWSGAQSAARCAHVWQFSLLPSTQVQS